MSIEIKEVRNAVSYNDDTTIDNSALLKLIGTNFAKLSQSKKDEIEAFSVRTNRDILLETEVDPVVTNPLRWEDLSTDKQNEWKKYRTDLLDVPQQSGFPYDVTFPTKPS